MNQYVSILNTKTSSILLGSASACSAWLNCRFFVHVHQENTYKTWTSRLKGPKRNGRTKEIESTFISSINLHHILLCIAHSNIPQPSQPLNPLDEHPGWRQDDCSGGIDISADSPICQKKWKWCTSINGGSSPRTTSRKGIASKMDQCPLLWL